MQYNSLLILRIITCIFVVLWHISQFTRLHIITVGNFNLSWLIQSNGYFAVWIFIILSGYLIGKGFFINKYELNFTGLKKFYLRRICKIVPFYYLTILISFMYLYQKSYINNPNILIDLLLFRAEKYIWLPGLGPLWMISVLFKLYLISPLIYLLFLFFKKKKIHQMLVLYGIVLSGITLRFITYKSIQLYEFQDYMVKLYSPFIYNLDFFIFGFYLNYMIVSRNHEKKHGTSLNKRKDAFIRFFSYFLLLSAFIFSSYFTRYFLFEVKPMLIVQILIFPYLAFLSVGFYIYQSEIRNYFQKSPRIDFSKLHIKNSIVGIFIFLGLLSYYIYLLHPIIIDKMDLSVDSNSTFIEYIGKFILVLVLSIILGGLYHILHLLFIKFYSLIKYQKYL